MIAKSRVSVVVPTFNRAALVEQAVESLLAQTLQPIDVIVVDDGSTDETQRRLAQLGSRITYVRQEHRGQARARNAGMRLARGEYIAFLDADDLYQPYKLELQTRVLDAFPDVAMTYSDFSSFDASGAEHARQAPARHEDLFDASVDLALGGLLRGLPIPPALTAGRRAYFGNIFDAYLQRTIVFTNSMMFRRRLLAEIGFQDESLHGFEELDFALRLCRRRKVCFVDVPTYRRRHHGGRISTAQNGHGTYDRTRKQQELLHVTRRHVSQAGQSQTPAGINARLAQLHRAVAVPMMLHAGGTRKTRRRFAARARPYLVRCGALGHKEMALLWLSHLPGPLRRLGVTVIETFRTAR